MESNNLYCPEMIITNEPYFSSMEQYRKEILSSITERFNSMLLIYRRIYVIRYDIRLPKYWKDCGDPAYLFSELLRRVKNKLTGIVHYVWVREQTILTDHPHWHLLLLLNGDEYRSGWGIMPLLENIWATLLRTMPSSLVHLTSANHIPGYYAGGVQVTRLATPQDRVKQLQFVSYLAKIDSKNRNLMPKHGRFYGTSQLK